MKDLTSEERMRYSRQMLLPGWGEAGQARIGAARVLVVGAGGLGSPASLYLAAAGVGELRICDHDTVDLSNLNRQVLHTTARLGRPKALSAAETLQALNPQISILPFPENLNESSLERIAGSPDIVIDCLDNYTTRLLINRYCLERGIPLVHGAIWGMVGQLSFIQPPETPCLRCLVRTPPPKEVFPVVGAIAGMVGSLQALEALKYLSGVGTLLKCRLLVIDGEEPSFLAVEIRPAPDCPECGKIARG